MFAVPLDEIGPMLDRSPAAARQLASRARRRVTGAAPPPDADLARQRRVVDAYLTASRTVFEALVVLLHPDVGSQADRTVGPARSVLVRGAGRVPRQQRPRGSGPGSPSRRSSTAVGLVMAPQGRLFLVLGFTIVDDLIKEIEQ